MSITEELQDQEDLHSFILNALRDGDSHAQFELHHGDQHAVLDAAELELLLQIVKARGQGMQVSIIGLPETITTGQAADLLGVSRPTVVKMVDDGTLGSRRVATHRRVFSSDVLKLRDQAENVSSGLDELAALTEELGLQDT